MPVGLELPTTSSPRMWGCFCHFGIDRCPDRVFPTHVGVFPTAGVSGGSAARLPHACGGVSEVTAGTSFPLMVFPTHVGVFLVAGVQGRAGDGLPHACGGVSVSSGQDTCLAWSSPRMWGCFRKGRGYRASHKVFPTHVGVFPYVAAVAFRALRLPHACGGVSLFGLAATCSGQSSPRMWGCFYRDDPFHLRGVVFPTHVGVFPSRPQSPPAGCCLPHACGGVSTILYRSSEMRESSPRMWGCFLYLGMVAPLGCVFPTHVGVFPG